MVRGDQNVRNALVVPYGVTIMKLMFVFASCQNMYVNNYQQSKYFIIEH
jgi:hypothetical protein